MTVYYEALDEIEAGTPLTATREWLMEEISIREWFKQNPRYGKIIIECGRESLEDQVKVLMEDWPEYVDFSA